MRCGDGALQQALLSCAPLVSRGIRICDATPAHTRLPANSAQPTRVLERCPLLCVPRDLPSTRAASYIAVGPIVAALAASHVSFPLSPCTRCNTPHPTHASLRRSQLLQRRSLPLSCTSSSCSTLASLCHSPLCTRPACHTRVCHRQQQSHTTTCRFPPPRSYARLARATIACTCGRAQLLCMRLRTHTLLRRCPHASMRPTHLPSAIRTLHTPLCHMHTVAPRRT